MDEYIDQDEALRYGPFAVGKLRTVVKGLVPGMDAAVDHVAKALDEASGALQQTVESARGTAHTGHEAVAAKQPVLDEAIDFLGRFSTHLDAQKGAVDRKFYFDKDGTARGVGTAAAAVLQAVGMIATRLDPRGPVSDAARWKTEAQELAARLAPSLAQASSEKTARHQLTPALAAGRAVWLNTYRAAKELSSSVLRLAGRHHLQREVFADLQGVSASPPPPPAPRPPAS